ncbi:hypothetical protein [Priestia filamentosa]|uniref:hypothetical protein n=1 Tax=Priestia filamentosa TaxID=1402861 RepID=UPI0003046AF9|nr:hypothetical protein [Priestia filamentosa]
MTHNWLKFKIENLHMAVPLWSICKIKDGKELIEEREKELKLYSGKELLGMGKNEKRQTLFYLLNKSIILLSLQ